MTYHFKLEALRQYRQFKEEVLQKELSDAERHKKKIIARLEAYITQRTNAEKALKQSQKDSESGAQIKIFLLFLERLATDIKTQQNKVREANQACDLKRKALLEAMKRRKVLDKLKEKELKAYLNTLDQKEQKFINEIAINRHTLKAAENERK